MWQERVEGEAAASPVAAAGITPRQPAQLKQLNSSPPPRPPPHPHLGGPSGLSGPRLPLNRAHELIHAAADAWDQPALM